MSKEISFEERKKIQLEMLDEIAKQGFLYKQEEIFKVADSIEEIFELIQ